MDAGPRARVRPDPPPGDGPVPGVVLDAEPGALSVMTPDGLAGAVVRSPARLLADSRPVWVTVVVDDLDGVTRRRIRQASAAVLAASRLPDAPTLLPWLDAGEDDDGRPYLVAPRVGPSLVTLSPATPDRPGLALAVLRDVAAALAAVHGAGLVHAGVGATAVEHREGTASLALAPPLPAPVAELETALGGGTGVEPVEVLAGRPWTAAGDVHALCALVVAVATARPLVPATAAGQAARLQRLTGEEEHPDLRDALPPAAAAAVVAGLRRDPAARPSAAELARAAGGEVLDGVVSEEETLPPRRGATAGVAADLGETVGRPLGSRYLLDEVIGRGASGRVWRGRRRGDGTPVAVKVLRSDLAEDPDVVLRFLRERTTLTGLDHPHLVRVLDLVAEGDTLAIVMQLVEGGDLSTAGPLPPATVCRLLAQTAAALDAVHAAGVVHRDLKPANILLTRRDGAPQAMLTDFGLARAVDSTALTRLSQLVGTPAYLAPELVAGREPTPAADLYALGVTAYELLAGRRPFGGDSAAALMRAHLDTAPPRPQGMPDSAWALLSALLTKDPAARPDARTATAAFDALADGRELPGFGADPHAARADSAERNNAERNDAERNDAERNDTEHNDAERNDAERRDPGGPAWGVVVAPEGSPRGWTASSFGARSVVSPVPVPGDERRRGPWTDGQGSSGRGPDRSDPDGDPALPPVPPADATELSLRPPPPDRPEPGPPRRRRRWPWIAGAAAVVVLGAGTGVLLAAGGDGTPAAGPSPSASATGPLRSFAVPARVELSGSGLPRVSWDGGGLSGVDFFLVTSTAGTALTSRVSAGESSTLITQATSDGCYVVLAVGADGAPPSDTPGPACLPASSSSGSAPTTAGATP